MNHGLERRSPTMMKGADGHGAAMHNSSGGQNYSKGGPASTTSPTLIHHQDLSGVIASNSNFRYDDSIHQQKARNTAGHYAH